MTDEIQVGVEGGLQVMRFNRPDKKNALTQEMYKSLCTALESGDANDDVAVHVFLGASGLFTAGNDIGEFLSHGSQAVEKMQDALKFVRLLPQVKKPMVAGVDGPAVGIGTTMLFHCDMVFASTQAVFSTPFLDLGLVPEAASSLLFPRRMGYARAFEMLVMGASFDAERMVCAGLVNRIIAPAELETATLKAATMLARKPPAALRIAREMMRGNTNDVVQRNDEEAEAFVERLKSPEAAEAFQAFLEKRAPDFSKVR